MLIVYLTVICYFGIILVYIIVHYFQRRKSTNPKPIDQFELQNILKVLFELNKTEIIKKLGHPDFKTNPNQWYYYYTKSTSFWVETHAVIKIYF